jgi:hypothetical protein
MRGPQSNYLTRAHYGAETLTRRARHASARGHRLKPPPCGSRSQRQDAVGWRGKKQKKEGDGPRVEESWAVIGGNRPKAAR